MTYFPQSSSAGEASTLNNLTSRLLSGATFTGSGEQNNYPNVMVSCLTDCSGLLYFDFSPDNTNWSSFPVGGFTVSSGIHEFHTAVKGPRYFRARLQNTDTHDQSYVRLYSYFGSFNAPNAPITQTINSDSDATVTRSILIGQDDGGFFNNVPTTAEGHLEVAIHSPMSPFGAINTTQYTPMFQVDGVYGIPASQTTKSSGHLINGVTSGSVSSSGNLLRCSTGTTQYSFSSLQSRKRLRYRPGQGVIGRFTTLYSQPESNGILVAGLGTAEAGFYVGYSGTMFGALYSNGGIREIQTLTVTTPSTSTSGYQVTLGGVSTTVAATSNSSTVKTAYEISLGTYPGWDAAQEGSTVRFLANSVGNKTGTFSVAQAGAATPTAGTFSETLAGSGGLDIWVPQSEWNVDKLDGSGSSGFTLNPQKGNIFQYDIQYLGFGSCTLSVEVYSTGNSNNPVIAPVHYFRFPNTRTSATISQPSFPFTMSAYSAGSSGDIWVATASFAGFIEGEKKLNGPRFTYYKDTNGYVGSTVGIYYPLFSIRNTRTNHFATRANQSVVNLLSFSGAHDDATPVTLYIIKNASLSGIPNFTQYSATSCTYWDTAATGCTISDNDQIIYSLQMGQASDGSIAFEDEITLQPGEVLTVAARAVTGTATYVSASINTREDQ